MTFTETRLKGCYLLEPNLFSDERGYFFESYNKQRFDAGLGLDVSFVQDNQSYSTLGTIRGIHYQRGAYAQAKLVRVLSGRVMDVAVDLRAGSPTFGQYVAVELSADNKKQLFIPRGFGHGFSVLSKTAEFFYKCDNYYDKASEGGIVFNDPELNIDWGIDKISVKVSEKDRVLPTLKKAGL